MPGREIWDFETVGLDGMQPIFCFGGFVVVFGLGMRNGGGGFVERLVGMRFVWLFGRRMLRR